MTLLLYLAGAAFAVLFYSRILLFLLKAMGDNAAHIYCSHALTYAFVVGYAALTHAMSALPNFGWTILLYGLSTAFWLGLDVLALRRRVKR